MINDTLKKLRFSENLKSLIINAPKEYLNELKSVKFDTVFEEENKNRYDFVQVFATQQSELEKLVVEVKNAGKYDCIFWSCYPKGGGKIKSDIKRDTVWIAFEKINLRPVSQIAIDETWSALRGRPHEVVNK